MKIYTDMTPLVDMVRVTCVVSGEVTYRSKFLKSETYKRNLKANRIVVSEFGTMIYPDPCQNIFSRYGPSRVEIWLSPSRRHRDLS